MKLRDHSAPAVREGQRRTHHSGTFRALYDLQGVRVGEEEGDHVGDEQGDEGGLLRGGWGEEVTMSESGFIGKRKDQKPGVGCNREGRCSAALRLGFEGQTTGDWAKIR